MPCLSLTFGDQAENHARMQIIGSPAENGFSEEKLKEIQSDFESQGFKTELVDLSYLTNKASVLIVRNYVKNHEELYAEHIKLDHDKKAFMWGRVVNKHARHNLCYADFSQEPDYENCKGRVIDFKTVPLLNNLRQKFNSICDKELMCELNVYYDISKCGIGFHGDTERKIVICARLGESIPMHFQWYKNSLEVGERIVLPTINSGDIYVMSKKAVGFDWKKKSILTLRHSAGCEKFLK